MRIVVLGAGYAGVTLARRLESKLPADVELVVVDERPTHLVQHEVHRVVRAPDVADAIEVPLADVFDRARIVTARVESVDRDARLVHLADVESGGDVVVDGTLDYDYAAVCLGARTAYYDLPGVDEYGLPLKSVDDALAIREAFLDAAATGDPPRVVVGGAGLSGVQVAGELAALADEEGVDADVVLLEMADAVAPTFPESFQHAVRDELLDRGVDVRTSTQVERATDSVVETNRGDVAYDVFVWTGGITGTEALGGERPLVRRDLRLDDHTFVVGDAARVVDADGQAVPASASAALREARVVASNLAALVRHDREAGPDAFEPRLDPYRFSVPGWIVSVGDGTVAQVGPSVVTGAAARAMKATVGAGHLSSVGAVRQAVSLVDAELGAAPAVDALAPSDLPDGVSVPSELDAGVDVDVDVEVPDPADVHDVGGASRPRSPEDPVEIEIDVTDEADASAADDAGADSADGDDGPEGADADGEDASDDES